MDQPRPSLGDYARRYFEAGWPPLELPAGAKAPPPEGRTGYGGVDLTLAEVEAAAWTGNLAVRMPADVLGLDFDHYRGGKETLRRLVERCGPLPPTFISHSGRNDGSGIRYYRVPYGMSWVHALPGMEVIQRSHRYAVVAPSVHPDGRLYGWWDQAEGGPMEGVPLVEDLPELPWPWIVELSRAYEGEQAPSSRAVDSDGLGAFVAQHGAAEAPQYVANAIVAHYVERVAAGYSRHDSMTHCLTWAMESAAAGICSAQAAIDALAAAWTPTHTDARRAELVSDRRTTEWDAMVRWAVGRVLVKSPEELAKLHDQVCGPHFLVAEVVEQTRHNGDAPPSPDDGMPVPVDWHELFNRDRSKADWLVEDFWPRGRLISLTAPRKERKSLLMLYLSVCLAQGRCPWTGRPVPPVIVGYLDFEMTEDDLQERLEDMGCEEADLDRLHYFLRPDLPLLDTVEGGRQLLALLDRYGIEALLIDTFSRVIGGEDYTGHDVRNFYRWSAGELKARGVSLARLDHTGHEVATRASGSSAKGADVDVGWVIHPADNGGLTLEHHGLSRINWVPDRLTLVMEEDPLAFRRQHRAWPQGTIELAQRMDALGLGYDLTANAAMKALKALGEGRRRRLVQAAVAYRGELLMGGYHPRNHPPAVPPSDPQEAI